MADLATEKGVKHLVPFTYSFMPTARYLKELIDDGYLGKLYHLNMRYYAGYARDGDYMWRFDLAKAGSGVVGDLGTHFLYLARWLFGEIVSVSCQLGYNIPRPDKTPEGEPYELGDDMAIITLKFANGASGVVHVTAVCYEDTPFGQTHHMEFHGSEGTLYSFTDWDTIQQVTGARVGEGMVKELPIPDHIWGNARRDKVPETYKDMFRVEDHMVRGFIDGIVNDKPLSPDFHDGARIQRILSAAIQSHQSGCRVEVDSVTV
jgi:predicted dehydrogenase